MLDDSVIQTDGEATKKEVGMPSNSLSSEDFNSLIIDLIEAEYELETRDVNIFEILGLQSYEIRHSNFIAWLLDPNETHGLNDLFLQRLVLMILEKGAERGTISADEKFQLLLADLNSATVEREKFLPGIKDGTRNNGYVDILVTTDKFLICIENKIESGEGKNQLSSYKKTLDKRYQNLKRLYVYLTRDGVEASDEEDKRFWTPIGYSEIKKDVLEPIVETVDMDESVELLVKQYIQTLGRYVVDDEKIREKCLEIYRNHADVLDIIFANKPDAASDITSAVIGQLEAIGKEKGIVFNPANCGSKVVRFRTTSLMEVHPLLAEQDYGIWGQGRNKAKTFWFFEIKFSEDKDKEEIKVELWFTLYDKSNVLRTQKALKGVDGSALIDVVRRNDGKNINDYPQLRLLDPWRISTEGFYENPDKETKQVIEKCLSAQDVKTNSKWATVVEGMRTL